MWDQVSAILNILFFCGGAVCVLARRIDWMLALVIFSFGVGGFPSEFGGAVWNPTRVAQLCACFYILIDRRSFRWLFSRRRSSALFLFFLCIFISLLAAVTIVPATGMAGSGLQSRALRPLVQCYRYVSVFAVFGIAGAAVRTVGDLGRIFNQYSLVAIGSALLGWLQLGCYATGLPFKPILRAGEDSEAAIFVNAGGEATYRLYAFAGEPKALATLLLPILVAFFVAASLRLKVGFVRRSNLFLAVTGPVFVLTFSSAALVSLAFAVVAVMLASVQLRRSSLLRSVVSVAAIASVLIAAGSVLGIGSDSETYLGATVWDRSAGRLERDFE